MSAQGGTLRAPMHLPIRPVAVLLAAAIAGAIALSVSMRDEVQLTRVSDAAIWIGQADAYVASLEAAAVLPSTNEAIWNGQADAYVASLEAAAVLPSTNAAIWNGQADAYVASLEAAAVLPSTSTAIWNAQATAYVDSLVAAAGGDPKAGGHRPIEVNGEICGQCR